MIQTFLAKAELQVYILVWMCRINSHNQNRMLVATLQVPFLDNHAAKYTIARPLLYASKRPKVQVKIYSALIDVMIQMPRPKMPAKTAEHIIGTIITTWAPLMENRMLSL